MRSVQILGARTKVTADIRDFGFPHAGGGKIAGGLLLQVMKDRSTKQDRVFFTSFRKPPFLMQLYFMTSFSVSSGVLSFKFSSQC